MRGSIVTLLAAALLAGCAGGPPPAAVDAESNVVALARAHQQRLTGLDTWSLQGRIGLVRGEEGWHAGLDWAQQGDAYEIELDGPIGQAAARLIGNAVGITLFLPDAAPVSAESPEALIRDALHVELPVSGLRWWLTGRVPPGASAVTTLDEAGRLSEIQQDGWRVTIPEYLRVGEQLDLPRKLRLEHAEVTIKLVLREWHIGGTS